MPKVFWILFFTPVFPLLHTSPSWLPHLNSCLLHPHSSRELLSLSSLEVWRDATQKASRRWRAQHWRKVERRRQEEPFIPNAKVKRKVSSVLSLHFFFLCFFLFFALEETDDDLMVVVFFFHFFFVWNFFFSSIFLLWTRQWQQASYRRLIFSSFYLNMMTASLLLSFIFSSIVVTMNKATIVSLLPSPIAKMKSYYFTYV